MTFVVRLVADAHHCRQRRGPLKFGSVCSVVQLTAVVKQETTVACSRIGGLSPCLWQFISKQGTVCLRRYIGSKEGSGIGRRGMGPCRPLVESLAVWISKRGRIRGSAGEAGDAKETNGSAAEPPSFAQRWVASSGQANEDGCCRATCNCKNGTRSPSTAFCLATAAERARPITGRVGLDDCSGKPCFVASDVASLEWLAPNFNGARLVLRFGSRSKAARDRPAGRGVPGVLGGSPAAIRESSLLVPLPWILRAPSLSTAPRAPCSSPLFTRIRAPVC